MDGIMPILFGTVVLHLDALLQITHGTVVFKTFIFTFYLNCGGGGGGRCRTVTLLL